MKTVLIQVYEREVREDEKEYQSKSSQMTYDSYDNLTSYVKPGHPVSAPITIEYGDGTFPQYHLPVREKSSENIYIARGYHEGGMQTNERRIVYEQRNDPDPTMVRTETGTRRTGITRPVRRTREARSPQER